MSAGSRNYQAGPEWQKCHASLGGESLDTLHKLHPKPTEFFKCCCTACIVVLPCRACLMTACTLCAYAISIAIDCFLRSFCMQNRLSEDEINDVAAYVYDQSSNDKW